MRKNHRIIGVHITDRVKKSSDVQSIFTEYGCEIKTRLGLHEAYDDFCSPSGVVLLEFISSDEKANEMKNKLKAIKGVQVQEMLFTH
jgi:hypothetical protein